ncbi:MAG: hypothetical protein ACYTEL_12580 [Planctomycetota bacterium]|jgi:hypothetical protein
MRSVEIYNTWKERRSHIEIGSDFAEELMNQIYQYEQKKRQPLFDAQRLIELISAHPLAKIGLVMAGAIAGLVRVMFIIHISLFGC